MMNSGWIPLLGLVFGRFLGLKGVSHEIVDVIISRIRT